VETNRFNRLIKTHHFREQIVASALARKFKANLCFNESKELDKWDYVLYNIDEAWATSCEQQQDNVCSSKDGKLCFELYTYNANGTKRLGKLNYTKAKLIIYIIPKLNLLLSLETKRIRELVALHESNGVLETYTPSNFKKWKQKHDTMPTECALLPYDQVVLAAQRSVFTFNELNINPDIFGH